MRTFILVILFSVPFLAKAADNAPACQTTVTLEVLNKYVFEDFGEVDSNRFVSQNEVDRVCGRLTYGVWTSTDLSTKGSWGPGGDNEVDGLVYWDDEFQSPIGPVAYEFATEYYALAQGRGIGNAGDDLIHFHAEVSPSTTIAGVTLAPYVRLSQYVGVTDLPSMTQAKFGDRLKFSLGGKWNVSLDGAWVHNFTLVLTEHRNLVTYRGEVMYGGEEAAVGIEIRGVNGPQGSGLSHQAIGIKVVFGL